MCTWFLPGSYLINTWSIPCPFEVPTWPIHDPFLFFQGPYMVPKCYKRALCGLYMVPTWHCSLCGPFLYFWSQHGPYGLLMTFLYGTHMASTWSAWSLHGQHGPYMVSMVHTWSAWSLHGQHGPYMVSMVHTWSAWSIHGQHGPYMVSMVHIWSAWSIHG